MYNVLGKILYPKFIKWNDINAKLPWEWKDNFCMFFESFLIIGNGRHSNDP